MSRRPRSRRHGRRPRHADALGHAEAPAPAARPAHGRLGDRGGAAARARPARRRRVARDRATPSTDVEVAVQEQPLGTGDAVGAARPALEGAGARRARAVRRHAAADAPSVPRRVCSRRIARRGRGRDRALVRAAGPAQLRAHRPRRGRRRSRAIVEASDATPEELEVREVNSSIYVFAAETLWPALERLDAARTRRASSTSPTRSRFLVEDGRAGRASTCARRGRDRGREHARRARAAGGRVLRDRINDAHMLAGVTIVDPRVDLDRAATSSSSPTSSIHPFTVLRGRTTVAAGAEIGPHVVAVDADVGPRASSGPSVTFAPARSSRPERRRARSWR